MKQYVKPILEIESIEIEDIVATSSGRLNNILSDVEGDNQSKWAGWL